MIATSELFQKFKQFNDRNKFEIMKDHCRIEYATPALGLEIGFYSLSKTDLFVGGSKRGHLIKKPRSPFSGFIYYFIDNQLILAKRMVNDQDSVDTFIEYNGNYRLGYAFNVIDGYFPTSCFAYEMDKEKIVAFKSVRGYPRSEEISDFVIHDESYLYSDGKLSAICEKVSVFHFGSGEEKVISERIYDHFNGRYWS